jgi:hypothetical protein
MHATRQYALRSGGEQVRKLICFLMAGIAATLAAVSVSAQQGTRSSNIIIIGCLTRGAQNAFVLKDFRSGVSYRIDADAESIGWHVGHQLEIHGPIVPGTADAPRVKPSQVIYISNKCAS